MKKPIKIILLLTTLILSLPVFAQTKVIKGIVLDPDGNPLPGAGVLVKEIPGKGVSADLDGKFEISVPDKARTLVISSLGMASYEYAIPVKPQANIEITLEYEQNFLDQVVVTGYAQTSVKRITGSVGIVSSEKLTASPISSVSSLMQGQVAGVSISATTGQPGVQSKIRIRGTNNLSGSSDPLWVVDGVPMQNESASMTKEELATGGFDNIFVTGIGNINPNDIESITILKDAAAAAIYGSRAANGVIVVTTKKGQAGRMKVNYSNNFTWSFKPQRNLDLMNSAEKLAWEQELWDEFSADKYQRSLKNNTIIYPVVGIVGQIRAGVGPYASIKGNTAAQDAAIAELSTVNTDWYSHLFRNAFSHNHHLSLSGGSSKSTYYVAMGFNDDNGMLIRNNYKRYNLNSKVTMNPLERLKLEVGYDMSRQSSVSPDSYVDAFKYAYFANPYEKAYNADGSYAADNTYFSLGYYNGRGVEEVMPENGFSILRELHNNTTTTVNWTNTVRGQLDLTILKPLKFVALASYTFANNSTDKIVDKYTYTAFRDRLGLDDKKQDNLYGSISQNRTDRNSYVARGHFAFNDTFKDIHTLSVLAGAEVRGSKSNSIFTKRYNYDPQTGTTSLPQISGPQDEWVKEVERLNGEYFSESRYASFYASADYYLSDRYVFNASFRTDGSSNFGSDKQFNPTWSAGAAWHFAQEKWLKDSVLSHGTFRLAYGFTGDVNTSAPHHLVLQYIQQMYRYYDGKAYLLGTIPSAPNPDLSWEKTQDMKAGVDVGFFKDRLNFSTEAYYRLSTDVVTSSQVSSTTGYTYVYFNSANIMNSGIEATLSGDIVKKRDLKLSASVNFAYNYNKVLKYRPATKSITAKDRYVEGYPVGALITGKYEGIDEQTGLYSYELRPDAVFTPDYLNKADNYRFYLGTTIAPYTGGFNLTFSYKILRLSVSGVYAFGRKVYDKIESPASYLSGRYPALSKETVQSQYSDLYSNHLNVMKDRTDRWTEERTSGTKYPRIYDHFDRKYNFDSSNPMDYNIIDAIYLKDVSYMRIKTVVLSCNLPDKWLRKMKFSNFSFNLTLGNPLTFTSYDGMDPEVPGATYPTTRTVSFGINLGL